MQRSTEEGALGDRYVLGKVLGSGGAAKVFRAEDTLLGVERAVKLLQDTGPYMELLRTRLRNEARIMAQLKHPNVLRVYDIGVHEGQDFVVMDLAEGGSLSQWLDSEGPMHPAVAVHYTLQVLSALDAAHQAGVVHRDVKPQNVLLDSHGAALLADFGIALLSEDAFRTTRTNMAMGSMCFMAPEQRMDAKNVGPQADLYAVACSLYNLLTDGNPIDLFTAKPTSGRWDEVPEPLRPVLWRATRHDPEERYPDAGAMAADLARVLPELGDLPARPRSDEPSPDGDSLPLPSPEITASAISRITDSRVRRVTATSPRPPEQDSHASATFLPMDLDSEQVDGDSRILDDPEPEDVENPTLVPDLGEALARLTAAVPYVPTQQVPDSDAPAQPEVDSATLAPIPPLAAPQPLRRTWALLALLLLVAGGAWLSQRGRGSSETSMSRASEPIGSVEPAAVEEPSPLEQAGAPAEPPPEPAADALAEGAAAEAPAPAAPAPKEVAPRSTPLEAPPAVVASAPVERATPPPEAGPSSVVAGVWKLTASNVTPNSRLIVQGSDGALTGEFRPPALAPSPLAGSYDPESGRVRLKTTDGSWEFEFIFQPGGGSFSGTVTTERSWGQANYSKQ